MREAPPIPFDSVALLCVEMAHAATLDIYLGVTFEREGRGMP